MPESWWFIWLYTLIFAVFHSITATNSVKQRVDKLGMAEHHYRLLYSVVGMLTTAVWLILIHALPDAPLYQMDDAWRYGLYALQMLGVFVALAAFMPIDGAVFLGFKKGEKSADPFVVQGIFRYIRHPMYAGAMLFLLAKPEMSENSLHFALAVSFYFIVGSRLEEKRMLTEHPDYAAYKLRVGAFIPKLWNRSS